MSYKTELRFNSLGQVCGFICGQVEGLAATDRYDIPDELRVELQGISRLLADNVKHFDFIEEKTKHSTK